MRPRESRGYSRQRLYRGAEHRGRHRHFGDEACVRRGWTEGNRGQTQQVALENGEQGEGYLGG